MIKEARETRGCGAVWRRRDSSRMAACREGKRDITRVDLSKGERGAGMQTEYVVFCLDELEDWRRFGYFLLEADYLLLSLASHVEEGNITVAEANLTAQIAFMGSVGDPR